MLKTLFILDEVGTKRIQQYEQVIAAKLNRGSGQKDRRFSMVAEIPDCLMRVGVCITGYDGLRLR